MTPQEMDAKTLSRYAAMTGTERVSTKDYMCGVLTGRWGAVSYAGMSWARRVLVVMGEPA